jgi:glycosyltransferase involved in cell wall biosynthesis
MAGKPTLEPQEQPIDEYWPEEDISVAVLYPGNRADKMVVPLEATGMDVEVDPDDAYQRDIVVADNADTDLGREVVRKQFHDAKLVYRMRGDVYRELELWDMHRIKKWAAFRVIENLDGVIAVTDMLAEKAHRKSGVFPVGSAGLWKRVDDWPSVEHSGQALNIITLTNANYWRKIRPIIDFAPVVERWLQSNDGHWYVCGDGDHANRLEIALDEYTHVSYEGHIDAKDYLEGMNLMFHPSHLDGQPNSILEGMASRLPVITNNYEAFRRFDGPLYIIEGADELTSALDEFKDVEWRKTWGQNGFEHVKNNHTPEAIGQQYVEYFRRLLSYERE